MKQPSNIQPPTSAIIALGTNLGEREENLARAAEALDALDNCEVVACSAIYRSEPWGDLDQPDFLNAAVGMTTTLDPHALLAATQRIEKELGKNVIRRWGPRLIDLDVLAHGNAVIDEEDFHVPHPRMNDRPFVYWPFRDVVEADALFAKQRAICSPTAEGKSIEGDTERVGDSLLWPSNVTVPTLSVETHAAEETEQLGELIGRAAWPGLTVTLDGELGAGKTNLVRGIAKGLGVAGRVQSPSYTLCRLHESGRLPLAHWDFYRMTSEDDLESAGYFEQSLEAVCAIEWASMFETELPASYLKLTLSHPSESDEHRRIELESVGRELKCRALIARIKVDWKTTG